MKVGLHVKGKVFPVL